MREFHIIASVYNTPEEVEKGHLENIALDLLKTSRPLHVKAASLFDAMTIFVDSWQYLEFLQQRHASWDFYCNDEHGNTIRVELSAEEWQVLEDLYT